MKIADPPHNPNFEELYKIYFKSLYRFAYHYVMCEEAYDIVQEVFIHFYENGEKLPADTNIIGYLLTATRNRCMNFLRHKNIIDRHENRLVEAIISWNLESQEEDLALNSELQRCINLLTPQQQLIIRLKSEGKSYQEIADLMNINTGTVNTHIARAYKIFRENFGNHLLIAYFISRFL
ncbi:MAG: RNA polymerase sigma-70 factor [Odoribacter sp.]